MAAKGKKTCPACGTRLSENAARCPCSYDFTKPPDNTKPGFNDLVVTTPSGPCPVALGDDLRQWVADVLAHGHAHRKHYNPSAIRYWIRKLTPESQVGEKLAELRAIYHEAAPEVATS